MNAEKARTAKQLKLKSSHRTALQQQLAGYCTALNEGQVKVQVLDVFEILEVLEVLEEKTRIARASLILKF
jgi:hypothetical protein